MAKKDENNQANTGESQAAPEEVVAAPIPDASAYVLQPTSYDLPERMKTMGDVPEGRFMEEVVRGSDEENSSTPSWDAHPKENQPALGVTEDGQPDTSGRKR